MPDHDSTDTTQALTTAITRLLKPLVRLLIHYQITYPFVSQLLKSIYLQVAMESFPVDRKHVTDSRLSLLTGVHRKDVRRLRDEDNPIATETKPGSLSAQVIASWLSLADYSDDAGNAKPLYRLSTQGYPSFEYLVEHVSRQDLRSRSLLDEWLRKKMVRIDDEGWVHLETEAFLPADDFTDKAYFFGQNAHDHLAASAHNLMENTPPYFDRAVYYNNLSPESIETLDALSEQLAMTGIKEINRKARRLQAQDATSTDTKYRFRFGAYFYSEKQKETIKKENEDE